MEELVKQLVDSNVLRTQSIIEAMRIVDRRDFVRPLYRKVAYEDHPLPIGEGQTISQPTTVAFMLELLKPAPSHRVLDVGAGSGWTTALLAEIVTPRGAVYGVERIPTLVRFAKRNLKKYNYPNATVRQAFKHLGYQSEAPFDRILVSASAASLPMELFDQLAIGGVMVIPIGSQIWKVVRQTRGMHIDKYDGYIFVPLR